MIQADLDYRKSDVDQTIQQYVGAAQGPSAELDMAFIMGIEIGSSILLSVQIIQNLYFHFQAWHMCMHKKDCLATMVFGTGILTHCVGAKIAIDWFV